MNIIRLNLLAAALILTACAKNIPTTFVEPETFERSSYCTAAGTVGPFNLPENIIREVEEGSYVATGPDTIEATMTLAALEIAHASSNAQDCNTKFQEGETIFWYRLYKNQDILAKKGGFKPSKNKDIFLVQKEITRHWREDQAGRSTYIESGTKDETGADYWANRLSFAHSKRVDASSKDYIEALLKSYDWIDINRFGKEVSAHAWIIVQHADDHPEFQKEVLKKMEPYLETKGIKPYNYAFLWDRVAVNTGRKQRYGTQPTWECENGKLTLQPLEDPENVNARRERMDMDNVEEGLKKMARGVCQ